MEAKAKIIVKCGSVEFWGFLVNNFCKIRVILETYGKHPINL